MGIIAKFPGHYYIDYPSPPTIVWTDLTQINQLDQLITESAATPVVIFKHSTRCDLSAAMLMRFERTYEFNETALKPVFLDLRQFREVSDEISSRFGVVHQSPQLLLIKDKKVVYSANHDDIFAKSLEGKI